MATLRDALKSEDFALTAKLSMERGQRADKLVEEARVLATAVDGVQIPDNAFARPHISSIAAATLLTREGIDPIVHLNCRDRNRIAIQSDLLGAHALGIGNILLMRGSSLPPDHMPRTSNVYDLSAIDFIQTAKTINDKLPDTAKLHIGATATAFKPVEKWEPEKLSAKADAGAEFVQLQVCMNIDMIREYIARLVEARLTWRVQFLVGIAVFPSAEAAKELKQLRPDSIVPREIVGRLAQASDAVQEGIDIGAEMLAELRGIPGVAGANLMTSGEPTAVVEAIRASGLRSG